MENIWNFVVNFLKSSEAATLIIAVFVGILTLIIEYYVIIPLKDKKSGKSESYGKKLKRLVEDLLETSKEVDSILGEIAQTTREREATATNLESEIKKLEISEKEYKERIDTLKTIPIPAIDHLLKQMEPNEKRNARRDYLLFLAGVIASTIISVVLNFLGFGN